MECFGKIPTQALAEKPQTEGAKLIINLGRADLGTS